MSTKPDGKSNATQRVTFTRNAAERIAKVVRRVELGPRGAAPLRYDHIHAAKSQQGATFRIGTFTGAWNKNQLTTVTFRNQTSTPNTATAINLFANIAANAMATRNCAIAKDGTAWYLIAAEC